MNDLPFCVFKRSNRTSRELVYRREKKNPKPCLASCLFCIFLKHIKPAAQEPPISPLPSYFHVKALQSSL